MTARACSSSAAPTGLAALESRVKRSKSDVFILRVTCGDTGADVSWTRHGRDLGTPPARAAHRSAAKLPRRHLLGQAGAEAAQRLAQLRLVAGRPEGPLARDALLERLASRLLAPALLPP